MKSLFVDGPCERPFNILHLFRCESCIDRLFTLGPAPCPICTKVLRKLAFNPQTFEDLAVEKEVAIRRRVSKEWVSLVSSKMIISCLKFNRFNKRREDFPDLRSYNDYLEMVEDIMFNLINEINVPETEARIAAYRAENAALIQLNIQREKLEMQELAEDEERERLHREERMRMIRQEEEEERLEREYEKKAIIEGLVSVSIRARGMYVDHEFFFSFSRNLQKKAVQQKSSP